jgi:hypothetical protein
MSLSQELLNATTQVVEQWHGSALLPKNFVWSKKNVKAIGLRVSALLHRTGSCDIWDVDKIYHDLAAEGFVFDEDEKESAREAAQTLPHRDLFPEINGLESAHSYVKNPRLYQKHPTKRNELNELLAYLQKHNVHDAAAPVVELTPKQKEDAAAYAEAERLIENVSAGDISLVKSDGRGPHGQAAAFKKQRQIYIRVCKERGIPGQTALNRVKQDIAELNTASPIR